MWHAKAEQGPTLIFTFGYHLGEGDSVRKVAEFT